MGIAIWGDVLAQLLEYGIVVKRSLRRKGNFHDRSSFGQFVGTFGPGKGLCFSLMTFFPGRGGGGGGGGGRGRGGG